MWENNLRIIIYKQTRFFPDSKHNWGTNVSKFKWMHILDWRYKNNHKKYIYYRDCIFKDETGEVRMTVWSMLVIELMQDGLWYLLTDLNVKMYYGVKVETSHVTVVEFVEKRGRETRSSKVYRQTKCGFSRATWRSYQPGYTCCSNFRRKEMYISSMQRVNRGRRKQHIWQMQHLWETYSCKESRLYPKRYNGCRNRWTTT